MSRPSIIGCLVAAGPEVAPTGSAGIFGNRDLWCTFCADCVGRGIGLATAGHREQQPLAEEEGSRMEED